MYEINNKISFNPIKFAYFALVGFGQTQNQMVYNYLKVGRTLTQRTAFKKFKIWRLASRINDLQKRGLDIKAVYHPTESRRSRYAEYYLRDK